MFVYSLNETLKGEIQDRIPDEPSFLEVWMLFIQTLQSDSMEQFKDMEKEVRSLQPQQFSRQNIAEMCLSIIKRCKRLTAAECTTTSLLKNLNFQLCSTSRVLSSSLKQLVYMYLSQLMSTFTNYLKVHRSLDGYFIL